jgi:integrase
VREHSRNRAIFLIAYRHGLRASEIGLLRTGDLDFKKLRIMVHRLKGSYSGEHPLQSDEFKRSGPICAPATTNHQCSSRAIVATRSRVGRSIG